jgi:cephalosporin hydroxylase
MYEDYLNYTYSKDILRMDLSKIDLIQQSPKEYLTNFRYVEKLIPKLGFNTEILREQPSIVKENGGGLLIWQYPNQFSKYLCLLSTLNISSYLEIGCRWGGTFVLTTEYLKRFRHINKSVAVDIIDSTVTDYCSINNNAQFIKMNSQSEEFENYIKNNKFDLIFIDGDHSYSGVKNDFEKSANSGKVFVFHDIVNDACSGVSQFWNELKNQYSEVFDFFEFTEQYKEIYDATSQKFLGIGVAIKK